jgi:hypothetical protein
VLTLHSKQGKRGVHSGSFVEYDGVATLCALEAGG